MIDEISVHSKIQVQDLASGTMKVSAGTADKLIRDLATELLRVQDVVARGTQGIWSEIFLSPGRVQ